MAVAFGPALMADKHLQTDQDVEQILRIAVQIPDPHHAASLRDRLTQSAAELGVTEAQLVAAEQKWKLEKARAEHLSEFTNKAKQGFYLHFVIYLLVNAFIAFNTLKDGSWGFLFPLLGWGIGLWGHAEGVFDPNSASFKKDFAKFRKDKRRENDDDDEDDD